jgi:beta-phosphoglucomutase-like phosphatase (HAD superfamily)
MKLLGMIFDFNGVLWWDKYLQEQAWSQFAEQFNGFSFTSEEMALRVHGRNNQHTLEYLTGTNLDDERLAQLSNQKETIYRDLCLAQGDDFKLSPGATDLLGDLVANGIPCSIATASGKDNLDFFVEYLHLDRWFEIENIVYDDGSRPGKPAADIYLQAAELLGLNPGDCVVVEDSLSGIQAAHAAGTGYIIVVSAGDGYEHMIGPQGVDLVVENLGQIPWKGLFIENSDQISV